MAYQNLHLQRFRLVFADGTSEECRAKNLTRVIPTADCKHAVTIISPRGVSWRREGDYYHRYKADGTRA